MSAQNQKDNFIREMSDLLGLDGSIIVERLKKLGYTTFSLDKTPDYKAALLADVHMQELSKRQELKNRFDRPLEPDPLSCLVPDCGGKRIRVGGNKWVCTSLGTLHYNAWWVASLRVKIEGNDDNLEKYIKEIATHLQEVFSE